MSMVNGTIRARHDSLPSTVADDGFEAFPS
ncbi:Uncharacterised protein [Mycobacteroides abscessus subsp. abscessus]|nr:Uncharacterised protein [Mycobacteroides abscessus subsp. abscessus]